MNETDWHIWRSKGLGSSDASIIMNVSPYTSQHQLWMLKTGQAEPNEGNWATRRGTAMEPAARAHYELMHDVEMPPALLEHYELPWLRASMDGWNPTLKVGLEIKCPGAKNHAIALDGKIPLEYFPQVQHQLFVSGADRIDYFSFDGKNGVTVPVYPNEKYIIDYVMKARRFWHLVETKEEPELSKKDWKLVRGKDFRELLEKWELATNSDQSLRTYVFNCIFSREDVINRRVYNGKYRIDGIKRKIFICSQEQIWQ